MTNSLPMNNFFFNHHTLPIWLPLFRCGTGLLLLLSTVYLWPDFHLLYGDNSLIDHRLLQPDLFSSPSRPTTPMAVSTAFLAIYSALCIFLITGTCTRLAAAILCVLHHHLYLEMPAFSYGFDYLAASALFYCVWFPVGHYHSVDRKLFQLRVSRWVSPCLRVLQIHLCIVYFFGGLDKLMGPTWRNGEAVWKALHLPDMVTPLRPNIEFLGQFPSLWVALGWLVIILEISYPLFIWIRATRTIWLYGIIGLHVGIALFLGLYFFAAIMVLLNLVAFHYPYHPLNLRSRPFTRHTSPPPHLPRVARAEPSKTGA